MHCACVGDFHAGRGWNRSIFVSTATIWTRHRPRVVGIASIGPVQEKEIHAMSSSIAARIDEMGARIESLDSHVDQLMERSKAASDAVEPPGSDGGTVPAPSTT